MNKKIGLLVLVGLLGISTAQANQLYRFKVDGRTLMYDHVPQQYSHLGYEILNAQGMVVRVVPPAPSAEELAKIKAQEAAQKAREKAIQDRRVQDQNLMRLYARPADVERARKRKEVEVETYVQMQQRRITDLEQKLTDAQGAAANFERRGQEVPADLRVEIAQLKNGIRDSQNNIRQRQTDLEKTNKEFAAQYERLRVLQVYPAGTLDEDVDIEHVNKRLSSN